MDDVRGSHMDDMRTNSGAIENLPQAMKPADDAGPCVGTRLARLERRELEMLKDEVGQRFGRLTVIRRNGSKRRAAAWKCLCDCGAETTATGHALRRGEKKSCGCGWRLAALIAATKTAHARAA
jgi:hypothetical protein